MAVYPHTVHTRVELIAVVGEKVKQNVGVGFPLLQEQTER